MNILVTLDSNYVPQLKTMLRSFFAHNNSDVDLYVIHSSLTIKDLNEISKMSARLNTHPIFIDDSYFENAHFTKRITKETYYRLLLCDYLPYSVDRILYLDPDIIINKPLDKLYNINFDDKCIAGAGHTHTVVKWFNKKRLNMGKKCDYINAGVLMINVDNLRGIIKTQDIFDFVNMKGKKLFQADQDVINALFWRETIYLPAEIYNLDENTYRRSGLNLNFVKESTAIIHYDGKNKPWKENYKGELNKFYEKYARESKSVITNSSTKILKSITA